MTPRTVEIPAPGACSRPRFVLVINIVVGDGEDGAVIEQRDHHDHDRSHRIEVKHQDDSVMNNSTRSVVSAMR